MKLGVCYYPEQWPRDWWADDARRMREIGISHVRIAEFAWSEIEPDPGRFDWAWLDDAVDVLAGEGLEIVMCTPTATPPKWLVDLEPGILARDVRCHVRHFGSRRHYCFSSPEYREHSRRITQAVAERYGKHPAVTAWQTDNEYGCHDTVLSTSQAARRRFREWLAARYGDIAALNEAWGTVFWSMRLNGFDEAELPACTVTEANPSVWLDWRRFASDEVVSFNREQVEIIRAHSPGRPVSHNFMGFFAEFNHHDVAADLDIAAWDSYPLGFTNGFFFSDAEKLQWARTGHPDVPAFHHDLYRGMCAGGRWWVMEQQPGPVNWARWNPAPLPGMVRLWTWQAFGHGAEAVSYFRWRQAPFAQEQMHAGLHTPDRAVAPGGIEAEQVGHELAALREAGAIAASMPANELLPTDRLQVRTAVAMVFDYECEWMGRTQPQGADWNSFEIAFRLYSALRQLGLDVDIVSPNTPLASYRLIVLPSTMHVGERLAAELAASNAQIIIGPRSGSKTRDLQIPARLPPGPLADLVGASVRLVESLPPGVQDVFGWQGSTHRCSRWREHLDLRGAQAEASFADGTPALVRHRNVRYVAGWMDDDFWLALCRDSAAAAGLDITPLPHGVRISRVGSLLVACNFTPQSVVFRPAAPGQCLIGNAESSESIPPCGVTIWQLAPRIS
jgi:beta-galactosidase